MIEKEINEQEEIKKKVYVKPQVRQVNLRPEEAVLGNCKAQAGLGPGSIGCNRPSACSSFGS